MFLVEQEVVEMCSGSRLTVSCEPFLVCLLDKPSNAPSLAQARLCAACDPCRDHGAWRRGLQVDLGIARPRVLRRSQCDEFRRIGMKPHCNLARWVL